MLKIIKRKKHRAHAKDEDLVQAFIQLLGELGEGRRPSGSQLPTESEELIRAWNKMVGRLCEKERENTLAINSMLGFITEMTYVKSMIEEVRKQNDALHAITASSEEMSATVDDVSGRTQSIADFTMSTVDVVSESSKNVKEAFSFVQQSFEDIKLVSDDMNALIGKMRNIEEVVQIIKGVADQTNMLALNAAIEAARAGEHGKGFAVVAGEVRKLAEHTKASISSIQGNIEDLRDSTFRVVSHTNRTAEELMKGSSLVQKVITSNDSVDQLINKLNEEIIQISSSTQEEAAAIEEFTQRIYELSQAANHILSHCDKTGSGIHELSTLNNHIRLALLKNPACLDQADMLDICKTDHLIWRWRVYNMILGYEKIDINQVGSHIECRLGKWYYGEAHHLHENNNIFKNMEKPHKELHELAKEAAIEYSKGNIIGAERALEAMNECSAKVIDSLEKLKKVQK